jgi:hypothetical protein
MALRVQDSPGAQLHIDWDRGAKAVEAARRGVLQVDEGDTHKSVDLNSSQLRQGTITYARHSGDVRVKLTLFGEDPAAPLVEEARFVGPAPALMPPPEKQDVSGKDKADLEAQIRTLRAQLAKESSRNAELQTLVRVLETRLGIQPGK